MFNKIKKMKSRHQVAFAIIIAFAVVSFWRGVWGLMDEYLLPQNYKISLWVSLVLGILILIGTNYATKELM
ncbi:hypothetical protein KY361_05540 [Candidatus Woesearchaeota archaeon]|nr:hypothetical protein [Candidatus Woesearchaeota archaeon]